MVFFCNEIKERKRPLIEGAKLIGEGKILQHTMRKWRKL